MNIEEFSNSFDTLLNSFASINDASLSLAFDEYEKSVFLTRAQEDLVKAYYSGLNSSYEGFEQSERLRRNLDKLVTQATLIPTESVTKASTPYSVFTSLPDDHLYTIYESAKTDNDCSAKQDITVVPCTHDDLHRTVNDPFLFTETRALRLNIEDNTVELISKNIIASYFIRYVRKPTPIILVSLPDGLSIEGKSDATDCELDSSIHNEILEKAVQLALVSKSTINK